MSFGVCAVMHLVYAIVRWVCLSAHLLWMLVEDPSSSMVKIDFQFASVTIFIQTIIFYHIQVVFSA